MKQTITANLLKMRHIKPRTIGTQTGWTLTLHSSLVSTSSTAALDVATASATAIATPASHPVSTFTTTSTSTSVTGTHTTSVVATSSPVTTVSAADSALALPALWRVAGVVFASWLIVLIL